MNIVEMKVPTIGESVTEVTLSEWLVEDGAYVELDTPICEFESDKATLEFPAEAAGKLIHVAAEGDDLEIGALVAKIDTSVASESSSNDAPAPTTESTAKEEAQKEMSSTPANQESTTSYATGHPSPAAAKILKEKEIDPNQVNGTGKDGRITKEDAVKATKAEPATAKAPAKEAAPQPSISFTPRDAFSRETRRKKMSRMRRTIARRLVSAKNETAMLTTFNEVDLSEVIAFA